MRLLDEIRHSRTQLEHNTHRRTTSHNNFITLRFLRFLSLAASRSLVVQLLFSRAYLGGSRELVEQRNGSFVVICCDARLW
jgi:hypothetical protein